MGWWGIIPQPPDSSVAPDDMTTADAAAWQRAWAIGQTKPLVTPPHCPLHPGAYFQGDWCSECSLEIEWARNRPHLQLVTEPANGQT